MSNLFPMLHAHFVLNTLETAAQEARSQDADLNVEAEATEPNKVSTSEVVEDNDAPATSKLFLR